MAPTGSDNLPADVAALIGESVALERRGDFPAALRRAREAQAAAAGDSSALAAAHLVVARVRFRLGQYDAARALAEEALAIVPAEPVTSTHAHAWLIKGMCAAETYSLAEAEDCYRRALDLVRETGDHRLRLGTLHDLAIVYLMRGQFDLALASDEESARVAREHDLSNWIYYPLLTLAWANQILLRLPAARAMLEDLRRACASELIANAYPNLIEAEIALDEGEQAQALELYTRAYSCAEELGDAPFTIDARLGLSRYHSVTGNGPAARAWADDAYAIAARLGYRHLQGRAGLMRGRAAWACGDVSAGEADLRAAIELLLPLDAAYDLACAEFYLAVLLHERADPGAGDAWRNAAMRITRAGYAFLLERERALAFPLIAAYLNDSDPEAAALAGGLVEHLQRVPPAPLHVVMLGSLRVSQGPQPVEPRALRSRRADELLALLLLAPGHTLSFDQIVEALWPDKEPAGTRALFHQSTSALRRALEPDLPDRFPSRYLRVEEGRVALLLPPGSTVDYATFQEHCRRGEWEAALALYQGDLLPDHRYADWAISAREQAAGWCRRGLAQTARALLDAGRFEEALDACRRLLALEPWDEDAVDLGMRACLALNDLAGARRLYRQLERHLRDELGVEPQERLQALYASLRGGARKR